MEVLWILAASAACVGGAVATVTPLQNWYEQRHSDRQLARRQRSRDA